MFGNVVLLRLCCTDTTSWLVWHTSCVAHVTIHYITMGTIGRLFFIVQYAYS